MNRKQFLQGCAAPLLALGCTWNKADQLAQRVLLEADLQTELLNIGEYKINATIGLFVQRISAGQRADAFQCLWMICTHARCFVQYRTAAQQFACPCHGSVFDQSGAVLQGPAAAALERAQAVVQGNKLQVLG